MRGAWVACLALVACRFDAAGAPRDGAPATGDGPAPADSARPGDGAPPGDTLPPGDGSVPGGPVVGPCGSPGLYREDFSGSATAVQWYTATQGGTLAQTNGQLVATANRIGTATYNAQHFVDLRGHSMQIDVLAVPATTSTTAAAFYLGTDGQRAVQIFEEQGQLYAQVIDPVHPMLKGTPYDPVAHRTWRISEASGTLTFAASPDGQSWTTLATAATTSGAANVQVAFGTNSAVAAATGSAVFDNLNPLEIASACKADTLHDAFQRTGTEPGDTWLGTNGGSGGCRLYLGSGAHADQDGKPDLCYYGSSQAFDLTGTAVEVQVGTVADHPGWQPFLELFDDARHYVTLSFENGAICQSVNGVAPPTCRTYTNSETRWRISESGGQLTFATSTDGTTYTPIGASIASPIDVTRAQIYFGTIAGQNLTGMPAPMVFTRVN